LLADAQGRRRAEPEVPGRHRRTQAPARSGRPPRRAGRTVGETVRRGRLRIAALRPGRQEGAGGRRRRVRHWCSSHSSYRRWRASARRARTRAPPGVTVLSFIVPAHNEEQLLGRTLAAIHAAARASGESYEIIVADDASTDATSAIARA